MLSKLTLEQKIDLIGGVDGFYIREIPSIKLPKLKMSDGPVGARNDGPSNTYPAGIALAATWNGDLAAEVGKQIGRDARARGVHFMLGPGVNIYLSPKNGRNFEYFGEDPYLAGRMAVNYIRGMQSQGVAATVKHFAANNSEFDRHNVDVHVDERALREIYLPAFEAAVKEGNVAALMDSYNLVNGVHLTQNGPLNTGIVKGEWGFSGIIMSDWFATYDGVAAANGGLDLEMPAGAFMNRKTLLPAVQNGTLKVATIDDKVRRILRTAVRLGWLDRDQTDPSIPRTNPAGKAAALEAARQSIVLLKNDGGVLPFDPTRVHSIAMIGPDAFPAVPVAGGSAQVQPFEAVSYLTGLSNLAGDNFVIRYARGIPKWTQLASATSFETEPAKGEPGLKVETYDNINFSGAPSSRRIDGHVNRRAQLTIADLGEMDLMDVVKMGSKTDTSTRWTGYYKAKASEAYEVFVEAPGESGYYRLLIDDRPVLDGSKTRQAFLDHAVMNLAAGPHKVVFERSQQSGLDIFGGTLRLGIVPQSSIIDEAAVAMAAKADAAVVAVGFDAELESEGGDRAFHLPPGQEELIRKVAAVNKNTVVVVTSGGAVDTRGWLDRVPGLLEAWYPGEEGGTALAEVLLGKVNPSGKLPISFDRSWEENPSYSSYYPEPGTNKVTYKQGVFAGYRGYEHENRKPLFPFGYGLSYAAFEYSGLSIQAAGENRFEVSFDVSNTGKRAGSEVAQVYVGEDHAAVPRPPKELKGFARLALQPGETRRATVTLDARAFAYFDVNTKRWRIDPGEFKVMVGRSSGQIDLTGKVQLTRNTL